MFGIPVLNHFLKYKNTQNFVILFRTISRKIKMFGILLWTILQKILILGMGYSETQEILQKEHFFPRNNKNRSDTDFLELKFDGNPTCILDPRVGSGIRTTYRPEYTNTYICNFINGENAHFIWKKTCFCQIKQKTCIGEYNFLCTGDQHYIP